MKSSLQEASLNGASTARKADKDPLTPTVLDENVLNPSVPKDPRGEDPTKRIKPKKKGGKGRNTESFDPSSTLVRPDIRVQLGSPSKQTYAKPLKHDDVVIVPELFGAEDDLTLYHKLVDEISQLQKDEVKGSEWISWHEGAHLIVKNPSKSPTFDQIIDRLCTYFSIQRKSVGTRFNWYKDSQDWKPFHHDSAAFNPSRAQTQNITVGVSFGATRELAFLRADDASSDRPCRIYFPQPNNGVFTFGRDVNIRWKHGINAVEEKDGKGRISIILWGLVDALEEPNSPPLLGSDGKGPHAASQSNRNPENRRHKRQGKKSVSTVTKH